MKATLRGGGGVITATLGGLFYYSYIRGGPYIIATLEGVLILLLH